MHEECSCSVQASDYLTVPMKAFQSVAKCVQGRSRSDSVEGWIRHFVGDMELEEPALESTSEAWSQIKLECQVDPLLQDLATEHVLNIYTFDQPATAHAP